MPDGIVLKVKPDADKDAADDVKKFLQALLDWMVERWSLGAEEAARIAFQKDRMSRCWPAMSRAPRLAAAAAPA